MTDDNDKSNVASIQDAALKKQKKAGKSSSGKNPPSLSSAQKQALFADWLNGRFCDWMQENGISLGKPARSFTFLKSLNGSKQLYEINENKELVDCHIDAVEEQVGQIVHGEFREHLDMTSQHIEGAVKYWIKVTPSIPEPPLYGFANENHLVKRRLPFSLENGPTPLFDEMFSRIDNGQALKMFVGSLFFPEANRQQYVWMYGAGNDGKGTFIRLLEESLGHTFSSQTEPYPGDRFWTYGIKDARLVVFPDTNNTTFVTSALCKMLTGNDSIRVEQKGGKVYSIRPITKLLFVSNSKPDITSEVSDKRRIIYCSWKPFVGEPKDDYEKKLSKELPRFFNDCIELYKKYCPNHNLIPHSKEEINAIIEENESPYQLIIDKHCVLGPDLKTSRMDMWDLITDQFKTRKEQMKFKEWLSERFEMKGVKRPGTRHVDYWWVGIQASVRSLYVRVDPKPIN